MVNSKILISLWLILVVSPSFAESWVSSPQKGWLWYKKVPKKIINHPDAGKKTTSSSKDPVSYRSQLKKFKEQLEEVQAKAVLMPTLENVHAFQVAQAKAINQASAFQEIWMLASMLSGNGYRDSDHPFPQHRQILQEQQERQLDQHIQKLARSFGLFFVFKKECPYCHRFSPIVRQFIDTYGFEYKAISPDGNPLAEFPDAVADNGALQSINPRGIYPALFLVNPHNGQVIPIAWGLINLSQLKDNLKTIIHSLRS